MLAGFSDICLAKDYKMIPCIIQLYGSLIVSFAFRYACYTSKINNLHVSCVAVSTADTSYAPIAGTYQDFY